MERQQLQPGLRAQAAPLERLEGLLDLGHAGQEDLRVRVRVRVRGLELGLGFGLG